MYIQGMSFDSKSLNSKVSNYSWPCGIPAILFQKLGQRPGKELDDDLCSFPCVEPPLDGLRSFPNQKCELTLSGADTTQANHCTGPRESVDSISTSSSTSIIQDLSISLHGTARVVTLPIIGKPGLISSHDLPLESSSRSPHSVVLPPSDKADLLRGPPKYILRLQDA